MRASRSGQSPLLLLDAIDILGEQGLEYAVIGALAAAVYGTIRASADADVLVPAPSNQLAEVARVFRSRGLSAELRQGDDDDPIPAMLVVMDEHGNCVELLGGLRGLDPGALSRAVEVKLAGSAVRFVGREDFIAMKCFAGGPQDLEDARVAIYSTDAELDLDLLRRITRRFGRDAADALEQVFGDTPPA